MNGPKNCVKLLTFQEKKEKQPDCNNLGNDDNNGEKGDRYSHTRI